MERATDRMIWLTRVNFQFPLISLVRDSRDSNENPSSSMIMHFLFGRIPGDPCNIIMANDKNSIKR